MDQTPSKYLVRPWLWISLVLIIIAAASFFGWYYYQKTVNDEMSLLNASKSVPAKTDISIANWKNYTNSNIEISLKYPQNWKLVEQESLKPGFILSSPESAAKSKDDITVSQINTTTGSPQTFAEAQKNDTTIKSIGTTTVGGVTANEAITSGEGAYYTIFVKDGNRLIEVVFNKTQKSELSTTEKQILSTFQFTK